MADQMHIEEIPDERAEWAEYEACFTPPAVAMQCARAALGFARRAPGAAILRVLDPCAGGGVFGQQLRLAEPHAGRTLHVIGAEPRASEVAACRHYDTWIDSAAGDLHRRLPLGPKIDLVVTNPPWSIWTTIFRACWPLLRQRGVMALLGPSSWGHSDEASEGGDVFLEHPPLWQFRIHGRVAFNGGGATDNRKCSLWVWVKGEGVANEWMCRELPPLPAAQRRWFVRPGTEEV